MARDQIVRAPFVIELSGLETLSEKAASGRILGRALQSAQIRTNGWNRSNFLNALKGGRSRFGVCCVAERGSTVAVAGGDLTVGQIADVLAEARTLSALVTIGESELVLAPSGPGLVLHIAASPELGHLALGLAAEISNWRSLRPIGSATMSLGILAGAIRSMVLECAESVANNGMSGNISVTVYGESSDAEMWSDARSYPSTADIDKFVSDARPEQKADTVKRLLDEAAVPVQQHASTSERMTTFQALFWLCLVEPHDDVGQWIELTSFWKALVPSRSRSVVPSAGRDLPKEACDRIATAVATGVVQLPGGEFTVGSDRDDIPSEPPAPRSTFVVEGVAISRGLVSRGLYDLLTGAAGDLERIDEPVANVSYIDAVEFCLTLERALGRSELWRGSPVVRLPTEVEWEAAYRGPECLEYPWGDDFQADLCNAEMRIGHPTEIGAFSPAGDSWIRCSDMAGNLREWTSSYAGTRGIDWAPTSNDSLPVFSIDVDTRVVIRGGSYSYDRECVRGWVRNTQLVTRRDPQTGFRFVLC